MNISKSGDRNRNNIKETSMLIINKLRADHVLDFAAEELKKNTSA